MGKASEDQTLGGAYLKARGALREAFHEKPYATPDLDARLLVGAACDVADHAPLIEGGEGITRDQAQKTDSYISRRCAGEPVARILGVKAFWGLDFIINEHTLVPRPETEGIVEDVLNWAMSSGRRDEALRIVDIGTGSGAILVSLLSELPHAIGFGIDISKSALDVAAQNAARHGVADRFQPVLSNYGAAMDGLFDVVVSNPPYIALHECDDLVVDVAHYDPSVSLFAGKDGLDAFRQIIPWSRDHLAFDGFCMMEHGSTQSEAVIEIACDNGFEGSHCAFDMANLPRFVKIVRN